ncbi:MAG TPA: cation-transporting P-type ATPase [Methanomicrobiales archaeon]|nr:cation-transporting P-type ATPase [Methanomicrobiales archaeon]
MEPGPGTGGETGLSAEEARSRLARFGPNRITRPWEITLTGIAKEEITEPMILLLLAVGVFYTLLASFGDALTLYAIIATLVIVEIANEYRAKKAISSLAALAEPSTRLIREGRVLEVPTEEVVPGDLLVLVAGTRVAADGTVRSAVSLQLDESSLTGESLPVEKAPGGEAFAGTLVLSGEGTLEAEHTGAETRIGKISELARVIRPPKTPLQIAMKSLAKTLVFVALFFSIVLPAIGVLQGQPARTMFLTGLALAFATIPEELPIIITMNLGLGSWLLSRENFLVKKLKAAETLGNATVILTDKTGTLTESAMKVVAVYPLQDGAAVLASARGGMTDLSLTATDRAIQDAASRQGDQAAAMGRVVKERAFDRGRKTRAVVRETDGKVTLFLSGAPEEVLALVTGDTREAAAVLAREAALGRRVIAAAHRSLDPTEAGRPVGELEQRLSLDGLISLEDPPRPGVKETIGRARQAGIRTVMVTGDHPQTAAAIAAEVGIPPAPLVEGRELEGMPDGELRSAAGRASVFARATPEHKYHLLRALQENGEIVAVTGDGVNDTLALKGADIGIAMGIKGTDAAKEAADIVIADDNFITLGRGIFEGRRIFDNLSKGVRYYLSVKVALIAIFAASLVLSLPFPFSPIQIILLELFMDLGASASFVAEPAEPSIDRRPPRDPRVPFLDAGMVAGIALGGFALWLAVFAPYVFSLYAGISPDLARTYAFSAWMIGHVLLALFSRSARDPLYRIGLFTNRALLLWMAGALGFLAVILLVPAAGQHLNVVPVSAGAAATLVVFVFLCMAGFEVMKIARSVRGGHALGMEGESTGS